MNFELLEQRRVLSAIGFLDHHIDGNPSSGPGEPDHSWIGAQDVTLADLDGDNDLDIVVATYEIPGPCSLLWYENLGEGQSFERATISDQCFGPISVGDMNGDGKVDIVALPEGGAPSTRLFVLENMGGHFTESVFSLPIPAYSFQAYQPNALPATIATVAIHDDVEILEYSLRDGQLHGPSVLGTYFDVEDVLLSGTNSSTSPQLYSIFNGDFVNGSDFTPALVFADFDGDEDLDAITDNFDLGVVVYENVAGHYEGVQYPRPAELGSTGALSFFPIDVDGNGTNEILMLDGGSWPWIIVDVTPSALSTIAVGAKRTRGATTGDIDGDGDTDIVRWINSDLSWQENRLLGDANDNGTVSFEDFLALSKNFGKSADTVWEDGDFNGDGRVSFQDFLLLSENYGREHLRKL